MLSWLLNKVQNAVVNPALFVDLEQTQENIQKFEHQAGLTDVRYSPHRGLSAEETCYTLPVSMNFNAYTWAWLKSPAVWTLTLN